MTAMTPQPDIDPAHQAALSAIQAAGVVGQGGAGFPAHAKLGFRADTIIANGAECELLLWSDKRLMIQWPEEVVSGVAAAARLVGATRAIVAVKGKYAQVVSALASALRTMGSVDPPVEIFELPNTYPAGDEQTLVQAVLGRTIPEMGLPIHRDVVVSNVGTLRSLHRALDRGEPVTSRLVTVTGEVRSPQVLQVPIGAPLASLVAAAGGTTRSDVALVHGGAMMGRVEPDPDAPVCKTTAGLLVLPESHPLIRRKLEDPAAKLRLARAACCLCMSCTEVCPRNALGHRIYPHRLMQSVAAGITADTEAYLGALLCCECGLCTQYGCPLYLDPAGINQEIKARLRAEGVEYPARPEATPSAFWAVKQVPTERLLARLQLTPYAKMELPLARAPLTCDIVRLPLQQGVGQPARAVVRPGDRVSQGQVVAEPGGHISAAVHASIHGIVTVVDDSYIVLRSEP